MVKVANSKVWINDAVITIADAVSGNGIMHILNSVLITKKIIFY